MEFKTIRVSIEGLVIDNRSVNKENDFLTNLVFDGNTSNESFKFNYVSVVVTCIDSELRVSMSTLDKNDCD